MTYSVSWLCFSGSQFARCRFPPPVMVLVVGAVPLVFISSTELQRTVCVVWSDSVGEIGRAFTFAELCAARR